jgi:hypothetical protein
MGWAECQQGSVCTGLQDALWLDRGRGVQGEEVGGGTGTAGVGLFVLGFGFFVFQGPGATELIAGG